MDSALSANAYLAIGAGGRGVVLKRLDTQCIVRGLLHPSVRDRLTRVRELAHVGVANLHGVGREGEDAYLIWEYVQGDDLETYATQPMRTSRQVTLAARELVLAVDALHQRGIVHGAIINGNVFISESGAVRLTHISPMLYDDPAVDRAALLNLVGACIERRDETETPFGCLVRDAIERQMTLPELGARLAAVLESRSVDQEPEPADPIMTGPRRRSLLAAALVALVGLLIAIGLIVAQNGGFHWAQSLRLPGMNFSH